MHLYKPYQTASNGATALAQRSLALLRDLLDDNLGTNVGVRLWDGTCVSSPEARAELIFPAPYSIRAALAPPIDLNPGRAFVEGWLDIAGDVEAAIDVVESSLRAASKGLLARLALRLASLPAPPKSVTGARLRGRTHSKGRDAAAIGYHYDQPIEFYRQFLDAEMVYSCAYWDEGVRTLEAAQRAKLDYILDKLRVGPGTRLLDIGCGWGALVVRAAQRGAYARGITLSRSQFDEARRRIAEAGLDGRAQVELRDYRDVTGQSFDAISSVGMVEHVGRERLSDYFAQAYRVLRPGGLFLNHGITTQSRDGKGYRAGDDFIGRYVFPDGDLVPLDTLLRSAESAGFEIRDAENLREHYARTLRAWGANLKANRDAVCRIAGERTERIWRLYMAGSANSFARGRMGLVQTLLAKPRLDGSVDVPATRRELYR
jgi:cyclopropane-fatty-acyl-phospholipid synthase